jgi:hypothetical protein
MEIVPLDFFGVHVDVPFPLPQGFAQARLDTFGAALCDPERGLNLRPEQLRLKRWDDLFGYELAAHFFGDNGTLVRTAERVKLGVRSARTVADWNIIRDTLIRFYKLLDPDPKTLTALSAHAHAKFPSVAERDTFLQRFSYSPLVNRPAALGYVSVLDWEKDIRVLIEQSNVVPGGVFVTWDTQFTNAQDWDAFLPTLPTLMDNAANLFDLSFEPLREHV